MSADTGRWFTTFGRGSDGSPLRLYALPHAGAGPSMYHGWSAALTDVASVWAVCLPGHETRGSEPLLDELDVLVEALAHAIVPTLAGAPRYAVFGHSMGARVAFELARRLGSLDAPMPAHLFVSGCRAPHCAPPIEAMHRLDDAVLLERLRASACIPVEVLDNTPLMTRILPVLRADARAVETAVYRPGPPLPCGLSALGGREDPLCSREHLLAWRQHVLGPFAVEEHDGGHSYLLADPRPVVACVRTTLRALAS